MKLHREAPARLAVNKKLPYNMRKLLPDEENDDDDDQSDDDNDGDDVDDG